MRLLSTTRKAASLKAGRILCAAILVVFAADDVRAQNPAPAKPMGRINFWFHSAAAASDFLAGDHQGVTSVNYAGPPNASLNAKIHANNMAVVGGIGGVVSLKRITVEEILNSTEKSGGIENLARKGVDALYVDEPVGPALLNECGSDCYDPAHYQATEKGVQFLVAAMNRAGDYFRSLVPGGKFGICVGDGGGMLFHIAALRAGLREDFACLEQYGGAHYHPFDALKKEFPSVKTMLLVYNTRALCAGNEITAFDTWGFWNFDGFPGWIPGPRGDSDWFENTKLFARGDTSFCAKPSSQIRSPITHDAQKGDFEVTPMDHELARPAPFTLGTCEYKVVSNGRETVPWRVRKCNQPFVATVGPDGDCRDKGAHMCSVYVRARTATGALGNTQYEKFSIAY